MTDEINNYNSKNTSFNVKKEAASAFKRKSKVGFDLIQKIYVDYFFKTTVLNKQLKFLTKNKLF